MSILKPWEREAVRELSAVIYEISYHQFESRDSLCSRITRAVEAISIEEEQHSPKELQTEINRYLGISPKPEEEYLGLGEATQTPSNLSPAIVYKIVEIHAIAVHLACLRLGEHGSNYSDLIHQIFEQAKTEARTRTPRELELVLRGIMNAAT